MVIRIIFICDRIVYDFILENFHFFIDVPSLFQDTPATPPPPILKFQWPPMSDRLPLALWLGFRAFKESTSGLVPGINSIFSAELGLPEILLD